MVRSVTFATFVNTARGARDCSAGTVVEGKTDLFLNGDFGFGAFGKRQSGTGVAEEVGGLEFQVRF